MFYIPADSQEAWRSQLADPVLHWKTGFSAKCLATSWLSAHGIPPKVRKVLDASGHDALHDVKGLLCFPEYKVDLPGGSRASQSDIFALAKGTNGLIAIIVEGKCKEPFGELVADWISHETKGKRVRLDYLIDLLRLSPEQASHIRYQLLHRAASTVLEAQRFLCKTGVMLVHSFARSEDSFADYCQFLSLYGLSAKKNSINGPVRLCSIDIYFGWVQD